jgi:hypothetical protein
LILLPYSTIHDGPRRCPLNLPAHSWPENTGVADFVSHMGD